MTAVSPVMTVETLPNCHGHAAEDRADALRALTLEVPSNEADGLAGPNDTRKTARIKLLIGLIASPSGEGTTAGHPLRSARARHRLSGLSETSGFDEYLRGEALLLEYGRVAVRRRVRRVWAECLLRLAEPWEHRRLIVGTYSRGVLRRLGLAHALIHDPNFADLRGGANGSGGAERARAARRAAPPFSGIIFFPRPHDVDGPAPVREVAE